MKDTYTPWDEDRQPPYATPDYKSTKLRAPKMPLLEIPGGADLGGPVFGHDILGSLDDDLIRNFAGAGETAIGERLIIHGTVRDEFARPVRGALLEVWQANAGGRYRHHNESYIAPLDPNFGGCGRVMTDDDGYYRFMTIKPGPYPFINGPNDWRPAHIHFSIFGHDFAQRLVTQMYFEGDPLIPLCPIVQTIPDQRAVDSLIARLDKPQSRPLDALAYRFDIVLRGKAASPFENRLEGL